MSDTAKNADVVKQAMDQTARFGKASMDAAGKATRDAIDESSRVAQTATERARAAGQGTAEAAQAATDMSSRAAEQGRDVMLMGMRTAAGITGNVADIGVGRGHHLLASAAQAMDIYRDASERSVERVQALFSSAMLLGRGLQRMQHAWLEMIDNSMENAAHRPGDLLRCKNVVELAEVQRELYVGAINHAFESTSRLLDLAGQTTQEAVRPLRSGAN